jgi:hypothetical protein
LVIDANLGPNRPPSRSNWTSLFSPLFDRAAPVFYRSRECSAG